MEGSSGRAPESPPMRERTGNENAQRVHGDTNVHRREPEQFAVSLRWTGRSCLDANVATANNADAAIRAHAAEDHSPENAHGVDT